MQMVLSHDRMQVIKIISPPKKNHNFHFPQHDFPSGNAPSQRPLAEGADACEQLMFPIHFPASQASCGRSVGASAARLVQPPDADPDPDFLYTVVAIESD